MVQSQSSVIITFFCVREQRLYSTLQQYNFIIILSLFPWMNHVSCISFRFKHFFWTFLVSLWKTSFHLLLCVQIFPLQVLRSPSKLFAHKLTF